MSKKQIYLLCVLILLLSSSVWAQQKWTLNQCISYAIENNINLKEFEILEKVSVENVNQSKRNMLPGIGASTNAGFSFGRSIDPNTNTYVNTEFFNNNYNLGASVAVFDGFRLQNQIKYQKFRKQQSEYNKLNAIDDLAFAVMTSFFDVQYYTGMIKIADEQIEASKLNLKTTEKQVEVGLKAKADLLEMRANLEREELNKIQIENALKTNILKLKQQMNFISPQEMELIDESSIVINNEITNPQGLFDQFTSWSPYYQAIEANLKATEKILALQRSQLYPSLDANGSVGTGFYETNTNENGETIDFGTQFKNNRNQYLGASLNIPIFSRWVNRSNIKLAKLEIERTKTNLEDERQRMFFKMANNISDLEAFFKEYQQSVKRSEVDKLAFRAAEKKFEQGLISVIEFYIAKNRLANTDAEVLRSRLQWEIKMKTLEFYKGQRFWEDGESLQSLSQ